MLTKNGKRLGRPPVLDDNDTLNRFLDRIAAGNVVRAVCAEPEMPAEDAVYRMVKTDERFRERLARARLDGAYALAESVVQIADEATEEDNPQLVVNRCNQRRWLAGKFNSVFADKPTEVNVNLSWEQLIERSIKQVEAPVIDHQAPDTDGSAR